MLRRDNGARSGAVRLREAPSPKQYKAVNPMFSVISASTGLGAWFSGAATGIGLFAAGLAIRHNHVVADYGRIVPLIAPGYLGVCGEF